jgi:hypothetical protein
VPLSIIVFLLAGAALAVFSNLLLPALVYRFRLRGRAGWASSNGFQRCEPRAAPLLEPLTLRIFKTRRGRVLSCASRGPLTVIDYAFTQSLGGGKPTDSVDVRRATTIVLAALAADAPSVIVRPRPQGIPRFLLDKVAQAGGRSAAIVGALQSSIESGDPAFDSAFQTIGDDEAAVRTCLGPGVRRAMMTSARSSYEIGGRHAAVSAPGLAFGEELDRMIETAEALMRELR